MTKISKRLISALKRKRDAEGLSIRALSTIIGVSFSTLARIERGDGGPDNNSLIRILDWLGEDGREFGMSFEDVALVHFRARKNADSKTMRCLLEAAEILSSHFDDGGFDSEDSETEGPTSFPSIGYTALSKPEMEDLAEDLRRDLDLAQTNALDALQIRIEGVEVYVPKEISGLSERCISHLNNAGSTDWSAMSVPLTADFDKWAVLRNDKHSVQRQRVTYLEECWHILLGHKLTKIANISDSYGRTYDSNEEHDAYYLASASLLPRAAVMKSVKKGKTAAEIAEAFGVSPELVEYRIKRLHLWKNYKGMTVKLAKG